MEIYNPGAEGLDAGRFLTDPVGDRDAFLLACHDISPYKEGEAAEGGYASQPGRQINNTAQADHDYKSGLPVRYF